MPFHIGLQTVRNLIVVVYVGYMDEVALELLLSEHTDFLPYYSINASCLSFIHFTLTL